MQLIFLYLENHRVRERASRVQWISLILGKTLSWSWYFPCHVTMTFMGKIKLPNLYSLYVSIHECIYFSWIILEDNYRTQSRVIQACIFNKHLIPQLEISKLFFFPSAPALFLFSEACPLWDSVIFCRICIWLISIRTTLLLLLSHPYPLHF